ncbi:MATE family efflux transporter [Bacteroides caecicola]|uniref:MATE family efflux transporter n=1 Tax=Bacteroides caecicola TaxID=1462569 RepID=A0ABS2FAA8_9BACE|nr:MATE family efflux transporter [Bacteroides caecicola]MBM6807182.1 MATE family efflux transporter [Bacteroides caecicola]
MKELDLTQGSVPKVLLRFAMPFLIANVLQALYGGADLFVVGQYDDAASVAGVAIGSQVMQTITGIILGLTTGTTILIAMGTGAKDDRKVAATIGTSVYFFTVTGIILTLVMVLFHRPIAALMHTPEEAMADTLHYILICSAGIPFIMGYNVVCGILRGLGDSKSPLYFVGLACIINIGADFLLVGGFGMRAAGAAIATVLSQSISFLTALWFLHRRGFHFEFTRRDIRFHKDLSRRIVTLGAPIALQDALINVSFLIITVIVNQMGVIASASLGVVEKIIIFAMLPPTAMAAAVATMTAQNYGAGLIQRMSRCLYSGIGISLVFGVSVCVYSQFLPETLTGIFTNDPAVIEMAAGYLRGYSIDCVMVSFVFCINSYFSGQGNSWFPMIHSMIATFLFRIPLSYLCGQLDPTDLVLMGYAPPLSTLVSLLICFWYLKRNKRKLRERMLTQA